MARQNSATLDSLFVGYGVRDTINPDVTNIHTKGRIRELQVEIDFRNYLNFATSTAMSRKDFYIPSGSQIIDAKFTVTSAFNLLTSIVIGTKILAGTTI